MDEEDLVANVSDIVGHTKSHCDTTASKHTQEAIKDTLNH